MDPGPVLAREWRGGRVQAVHTGHAVLLDAAGRVDRIWGDPATSTCWRSAAKPVQALAALRAGAELDAEALALACGSHAGQPRHVATARRILTGAGLSEEALRCGSHEVDPGLAGARPDAGWPAVHNNCSGKHAAMLAACVQRSWDLEGYLDPGHPLQQQILGDVARSAGMDASDVPLAVDGCGVPTFWTPLADLARAFRWLAVSGDPLASRALEAMAAHPFMVGGTHSIDTAVSRATRGAVVCKVGAAGVHAAVHRPTGAALAVKTAAGASLPRNAVTVELCRRAGWLDRAALESLDTHRSPVLRNHAGRRVGWIEAAL